MTIYYPDISSYNAGVSLNGAPAVCIKVTEGTSYVNPDYSPALGRAHSAGAYAFAYHFLRQGNAAAQAGWAHQHAGSTPLMLDFEPTGNSSPQVGDATAFIDEYRKLGGIIHLNYFPHWYWQQIGGPSLQPFVSRDLFLVSSAYTTYTDEPRGIGWLPYGGQYPSIWQYTSGHPFNGQKVDFNAFRGSLDQLKAMVSAGEHPPAGPPPPPSGQAPAFPYPSTDYLGQPSSDPHGHSGFYGGVDNINVHTWQHQMAHRGWAITQDGRYGAQSDSVCRSFQAEKGLGVDGLVGPNTWKTSWTAPIT
jgi:peptidoglycan hydrolase-like protein with peptidoglycan-binding domain